MTKTNSCYLYTLFGFFKAEAIPQPDGNVKIDGGDYSIIVDAGTAKRKFDAESNPTFYAC